MSTDEIDYPTIIRITDFNMAMPTEFFNFLNSSFI